VIHVKPNKVVDVRIYQLSTDLILAQAQTGISSKRRGVAWQPLFCSKQWLLDH
jgi:hypothetical protein